MATIESQHEAGRAAHVTKGNTMIVLGIILLVIGYLLPIPILATIGWLLLVVGAVLFILGSVGRPVGGRRYWF